MNDISALIRPVGRERYRQLEGLEAAVRQHVEDFQALDCRRKRAVNVEWLMNELRGALPSREEQAA